MELLFLLIIFFFSTTTIIGLSDHVKCFHCGKGLRNWETDDNPWELHARCYFECIFILLMKGPEYIEKV